MYDLNKSQRLNVVGTNAIGTNVITFIEIISLGQMFQQYLSLALRLTFVPTTFVASCFFTKRRGIKNWHCLEDPWTPH
jgi:hypothetical protein